MFTPPSVTAVVLTGVALLAGGCGSGDTKPATTQARTTPAQTSASAHALTHRSR